MALPFQTNGIQPRGGVPPAAPPDTLSPIDLPHSAGPHGRTAPVEGAQDAYVRFNARLVSPSFRQTAVDRCRRRAGRDRRMEAALARACRQPRRWPAADPGARGHCDAGRPGGAPEGARHGDPAAYSEPPQPRGWRTAAAGILRRPARQGRRAAGRDRSAPVPGTAVACAGHPAAEPGRAGQRREPAQALHRTADQALRLRAGPE